VPVTDTRRSAHCGSVPSALEYNSADVWYDRSSRTNGMSDEPGSVRRWHDRTPIHSPCLREGPPRKVSNWRFLTIGSADPRFQAAGLSRSETKALRSCPIRDTNGTAARWRRRFWPRGSESRRRPGSAVRQVRHGAAQGAAAVALPVPLLADVIVGNEALLAAVHCAGQRASP